ncbi:DUF5642 family protein [Mycolicibacterium celeriflavum]|uniref:DUF5642 domain-containing protein n=1 Tax=Mycolicibacterium celeriflavum TaxID=1249101 RepID=A0A7I7RN56_MYCCF|nr:DUF5642 family protein [Mycolicibacterium celeriflavum]MCV7237397.1 DUF5642 family protein [Mycolicibacterium celeriflavum]BBY45967.1 hypothetical protein MCEL_42620 [Mycolicibacterium celeriflavum]
MVAVLTICAAACGGPPEPSQDSAPSAEEPQKINPARIERARSALPAGYEVADLEGPIGPITAWGYGAQWSTDPPTCAVLVDPAADAASSSGWSASGPGGIVYSVVADAAAPLDPGTIDECGRFTVAGGRTTGSVTLGPAPVIDDAPTVALGTASTTVVEGGTETRSHANTVTAYLGDHVAFVTVVTDPGSPHPQLGSAFAATLMRETVSALRG